MATALPRRKPNGKTNFRLLFRALEKSKHNTEAQHRALFNLCSRFILLPNTERRHEAGFKQTLASTVRWYENNRRHLDKDILRAGLAALHKVFSENGYSSLAEVTPRPLVYGEVDQLNETLKKTAELLFC